MSELIKSNNISEAWLKSMRYLQTQHGEAANLFVSLSTPALVCAAVTDFLDSFLLRDPKGLSIEKTASTIFPSEFYLPELLGTCAQDHLYQCHRKVRRFEERWNKGGSYFDRMVHWQGRDKVVNQLERKIDLYRKQLTLNHEAANFFEIAFSDPEEDASTFSLEGEAIRTYDPDLDHSIYSFPCLSHISISLSKRKLHMTAVYRNQYFIQKAYGNFLGLLRLLHFLAREIGVETGELVCVATHADNEIGDKGFGKVVTEQALLKCEELLSLTPSRPIELARMPSPLLLPTKNGSTAHELIFSE